MVIRHIRPRIHEDRPVACNNVKTCRSTSEEVPVSGTDLLVPRAADGFFEQIAPSINLKLVYSQFLRPVKPMSLEVLA